MSKTISNCIFICSITVYVIVSINEPWILSDSNSFLKEFINHELLNLLGVIVSITLASAANLHIQLNNMESVAEKEGFTKTKGKIKNSAYLLIILFATSLIVSLVKPLVNQTEMILAFINGFGLLILIVSILVLIDLTSLAFRVPAKYKYKNKKEVKQ